MEFDPDLYDFEDTEETNNLIIKENLDQNDITRIIKISNDIIKEIESKQLKRFKIIQNIIEEENSKINNLKDFKTKRKILRQDFLDEFKDVIFESKIDMDNINTFEKKYIQKRKKILDALISKLEKQHSDLLLNKFQERIKAFKKINREIEKRINLIKEKNDELIFVRQINKINEEETLDPKKSNTELKTEELERQFDPKNTKLIRELEKQRMRGTVTSLGGFAALTSSSILARIIGNSTSNYISPQHKNNIIIGNQRQQNDDKKKDIIDGQNRKELNQLRDDIDHLKDEVEHKKNRKHINKRSKRRMKKKNENIKTPINLINIINKI